jgi:hypothetical protein
VRKKKILLAFEEYVELVRLQKDLMRLGFDVVGTQSEHQLQKELMEFNPELIIISTRGQKLSFQSIIDRIRTASLFRGFVFVLVPQGFQIDPQTLTKIRFDEVLPAQVEFKILIHKLCDALRIDAAKVLEKLNRLKFAVQAHTPGQTSRNPRGFETEHGRMISGKLGYRPRDYHSLSCRIEAELAKQGFKIDPQTTTFADPKLEQIRQEIRNEGEESGSPSKKPEKSEKSEKFEDSLGGQQPVSAKEVQLRELKKDFVRGLVKSKPREK